MYLALCFKAYIFCCICAIIMTALIVLLHIYLDE